MSVWIGQRNIMEVPIMGPRPLVAIPPLEYDRFLFAVIRETSDGAQLSVLSALTRANVDPWEEAARLSAMTEANAEHALTSIIGRISGRIWSASEEAAIASRLVRLLPRRVSQAGSASIRSPEVNKPALIFLAMWWSFAITVSVISTYQQRPRPSASVSESHFSAPESTTSSTASSAAATANDQVPRGGEGRD